MNVENIRLVADHLQTLDEHLFSMREYRRETAFSRIGDRCYSPSCIAGWTCYLVDGEMPSEQWGIHCRAMELLGLSATKARNLFTPSQYDADHMTYSGTPGYVSSKRASRVLHHLANTGHIDWSIR